MRVGAGDIRATLAHIRTLQEMGPGGRRGPKQSARAFAIEQVIIDVFRLVQVYHPELFKQYAQEKARQLEQVLVASEE